MSIDRNSGPSNRWATRAIRLLEQQQLVTPLEPIALGRPGARLFVKREALLPTGCTTDRTLRRLIWHALISGQIRQGTTLVDASAGAGGESLACFADLLELPATIVLANTVGGSRIERIREYGADVHLVAPGTSLRREAGRLADACGGHFLDQYGNAMLDLGITESTGEEIDRQARVVIGAPPTWVVVVAGTGATVVDIRRTIVAKGSQTRICVAEPERGTREFDHWLDTTRATRLQHPVGVDRVETVSPEAATAAITWRDGPHSSFPTHPLGGAVLWAALSLISSMDAAGESGSVVAVLPGIDQEDADGRDVADDGEAPMECALRLQRFLRGGGEL
jgi:cysteine synthase A